VIEDDAGRAPEFADRGGLDTETPETATESVPFDAADRPATDRAPVADEREPTLRPRFTH